MIRGLFQKLFVHVPKRGLFATHGLGHSTKYVSPILNPIAPIRSLTQSFVLCAQTENTQPTSAEGNTSQPLKEFKDMPGPWKVPLLGLSPELPGILIFMILSDGTPLLCRLTVGIRSSLFFV